MSEMILSVQDLEVSFKTFAGTVRAIRGVSFDLHKGKTLAIVGESGSGKTVTTRSIMRLLGANASIDNGKIIFNGEDLTKKTHREMERIRGSQIAMIFQDPMTSLNPTLSIGRQIIEVLRKHREMSKQEAIEEAIELLTLCGIPNPIERLKDYPHQFSGGQRQRIVIAIALAGDPEILIADEPTTALDVTVQAQIIELLQNIQRAKGMAIIFITHDLGVVANVADRVAVMYAGKIVEIGNVDDIYYNPQHPYTWGLLSAMPTPPYNSFSCASSNTTRPCPPASTTPASRSTSSWLGVLANAVAAAVTACRLTSARLPPWAAVAAARSTVITVPSTGSLMARSTKVTAVCSAAWTSAPVISSPAACAMPRNTWLKTTPELPRAPRTAPAASAWATSRAEPVTPRA